MAVYPYIVKDGKVERFGHPKFYDILKELADLHSRKNHDYASGGDPLGNFKRRAQLYSMYPGLDLSDPTTVVLVDAMKQLDAALWFLSNKHEPMVEGVRGRLMDISVYSVIAMILDEVKEKEEKDNEKTETISNDVGYSGPDGGMSA